MAGTYIQQNPDLLDTMSLRELKLLAKKDGLSDEDVRDMDIVMGTDRMLKRNLIRHLRRNQPRENFMDEEKSSIFHQAYPDMPGKPGNKPVFDEKNPLAVTLLKIDSNKFQCLEGEIDELTKLGPITAEELRRRGLAQDANQLGGSTELADNFDSMTVAQLKDLAEQEEIELEGATTKAQIIATIRSAAVGGAR
jgi:hypothetical protein